jgi:5'-phosphate synthase pdxT subunit
MRVGVLALQGDFDKHAKALVAAGLDPRDAPEVRTLEQLAAVDALVIPGGESTTIGKLMVMFGLLEPLRERIRAGMPTFGTCAGMIMLSREVIGYDQVLLGALDIAVERNAYGRQVHSFETDFETAIPGAPRVRGVFIRAPRIARLGDGVETLASFEGAPVLVRQGNLLASSFHPELTDDASIHRWFIEGMR